MEVNTFIYNAIITFHGELDFSPCHMDKLSAIDPRMVSNNPVSE